MLEVVLSDDSWNNQVKREYAWLIHTSLFRPRDMGRAYRYRCRSYLWSKCMKRTWTKYQCMRWWYDMCIASDGPKSPYQFTPRNTTVQFCGFLSCAHIRSCSVNDQLADMPGVSPGFCWGKWLEVVGGIKVILHLLLCRLLTGLVVCAMAQGTYKAHKERNYFLDKHSSRAEAATAITFIPRALKKEKDKKKLKILG